MKLYEVNQQEDHISYQKTQRGIKYDWKGI